MLLVYRKKYDRQDRKRQDRSAELLETVIESDTEIIAFLADKLSFL